MPPSPSDPPPELQLADEFAAELDAAPADERVYRIALQLYEATRVAEIADQAACAPDTARRHLTRLADIGVLEQVGDSPATYRRNEAYFEWRKQNRLVQLSAADRQEHLTELTAREQAFQEQFDADRPGDVDALTHAGYDQVDDVWMALSEWETVRRRIRRLEAIRQQDAESESEAV